MSKTMQDKMIPFAVALSIALIGNGLTFTISNAASPEGRTGASGNQERNAKLQRFIEADTNHDRFWTREEVKGFSHLSANFERIDANKDGRLDVNEIRQFVQERRSEGGPR